MDKEKEESLLGTITDAAKTSIDAAVEGVSSAASAIAAPSLAQQKSPEGGEDVQPRRKLRLHQARKGEATRFCRCHSQEHTKGDQGNTQGEAEHLEISQSQASAFRQESLTLISKPTI